MFETKNNNNLISKPRFPCFKTFVFELANVERLNSTKESIVKKAQTVNFTFKLVFFPTAKKNA
jgi:hypothetical protein